MRIFDFFGVIKSGKENNLWGKKWILDNQVSHYMSVVSRAKRNRKAQENLPFLFGGKNGKRKDEFYRKV